MVQEGDSLFLIAERVLGDGNLWRRILEDNQDHLASPGSLKKGQVLRIREDF